jgi:hypothetical protein
MNWYRLYVSSVGGGTVCEGPFEFSSKDIATQAAYDMAVWDYESFEGYNLSEDASEDECWEVYYEQRESWLNYWAEEASGPDDKDESYQ